MLTQKLTYQLLFANLPKLENRAKVRTSGFCALPFIEEYKAHGTNEYLCCYSQVPVTDIAQHRLDIWDGKKVSQCTTCYNLEDKKVVSPRERETIRWLKDPDVAAYLRNWTLDSELITFFYDIRHSNKCNLACIGCGPIASSLWASELDIKIVAPSSFDIDYAKLHSAKKIYLAGGEPFLIDEFLALLTYIADNQLQVEVIINTNLTIVSDKVLNILARIADCRLIVSIDSFGAVNEYHRWPMKWDKLIDNIAKIQTTNVKISFNTVLDAVSILGVGRLAELDHIPSQWSLTTLTTPASLVLSNLPHEHRARALAQVSEFAKSKFYSTDISFKTALDNVQKELEQGSNVEMLSTYINAIDSRRNINHTDYLGITL